VLSMYFKEEKKIPQLDIIKKKLKKKYDWQSRKIQTYKDKMIKKKSQQKKKF
jgi:hypothetical protein